MPPRDPLPRTPRSDSSRSRSTSVWHAANAGISRDRSSARSSVEWSAYAPCSEPCLGEGFDSLLDEREELIGHRAVHDAVVEGDREIRTRADGDRVFPVRTGQHARPLLDGPDAHDRHLRLADDRRPHEGAEDARVRDGEGTTLHFRRIELLESRTIREIIQRARDPGEREVVGVSDDRFY